MQQGTLISGEAILSQADQTDARSLRAVDWLRDLVWMLLRTLLENIRLRAVLIDLRSKNKELETENQELYERLNLGSDTSSIPSSKDWKRNGDSKEADEAACPDAGQEGEAVKETPTSIKRYLEGETGGKKGRGGQKSHPPAFMHVDGSREGEPVLHYPNKCANCPRFGQCVKEGRFQVYSTAYGYDIEIIRVCRKHVLYEATECVDSGHPVHEAFPDVIGSQFYDTNIQLHVIVWHHIFHGSYERIGLAAKELFGLSLSAGTAKAIVKRVGASILNSGFFDAIRFFVLLFEKVAGVDETSARVGGRNAWVHTVATVNATLLSAHWRRGYEGSVYAGVLQFYVQTLISDCWASYFNENFKFRHAICDGHILRELVAAAYFRQQGWAIEMFDLLLEIFEAKRDAMEQGEKSLPQEYLNDIRTKYRRILEDGFSENPGVAKGKTFSLLERLKTLEDAALEFAMDFTVDFTNNLSEQSVRNLKVVLRVIGQFKTMPGLVDYCIIQSFMDTCRKQGRNPYDMMRIVLSGGDIIEAVFGAERAAQIKLMIRLADAFASGDQKEVHAAMAEMPLLLTEELIEAASYGRFKAYNDPPPENKNPSAAPPKDKMKAARAIISRNKSRASHSMQNSGANSTNYTKTRIRAGPKSA